MSHSTASNNGDSYAAEVLSALEFAQRWLHGAVEHNATDYYLRNRLEEMAEKRSFRALWRSDEPHPEVPGTGLEYREPVWKIFAGVFANNAPASIERTNQELAIWFKGVLSLAKQNLALERALAAFSTTLKEAGVDVVVDNTGPPAAVWIHINPEERQSSRQEDRR